MKKILFFALICILTSCVAPNPRDPRPVAPRPCDTKEVYKASIEKYGQNDQFAIYKIKFTTFHFYVAVDKQGRITQLN